MTLPPPTFLPREQWLEVVARAPLVSIDLVVRDARGRVLLGLRRNEPARDFWFVPGGVIRKNERLDDAFARITRNELGVALPRAEAKLLGVYEHLYDSNFAEAPGIGTHYVVVALACNAPDALSLPAEQHGDWRWAAVDELLADPRVHENVKAYFR
jgi:colanic acid biosynthesis protein WcaH